MDKKISERALAKTCDVARDTLRSCEANLRKSKVETLEKLASALDHEVLISVGS